MKNKVGGFIGLLAAVVVLVFYLPPTVLYGIVDIGSVTGIVLAGIALVFAITQFLRGSVAYPKRDFDRSVAGGTRGRLHRQFNHDMGRNTVLIERGGLGRFTADHSIGYDGEKSSHAYLVIWIVIFCLIFAFFAQGIGRMLTVGTSFSPYDQTSQNVIVLGCGVRGSSPTIMLRQRIEAARLYLSMNPDAVAVVSGGQGEGEDISEAECMRQYLTDGALASSDQDYFYQVLERYGIDRGLYSSVPVIEASRIYVEDASVNTLQNISNSLDVLNSYGRDTSKVTIVTQWYHEYRAMGAARDAGVDAYAFPACIDWWAAATYTTRECISILYHTFF